MTNTMGLTDHPLTPLIVAWLEAVSNRAAYRSRENEATEIVARDLLNAALERSIYPLNEDPSGQRREPMSPHPLDDEPPFEIQETP